MKSKITRILGVALMLTMVLALGAGLVPGDTPTAKAAVGTLRFETIPLPQFGAAGEYVLTPATDLGALAVAPDGVSLYVAANITDVLKFNTLLKSTDNGYTWSTVAAFYTASAVVADNTSIVDIAISPLYATDTTLLVATTNFVYQSVDGGTRFTAMAQPWAGDTINDIDVTLDAGGRLSVIVGTTNAGAGSVYVYCPETTGLSFVDQVAGSDALAVAFSPVFTSDEGIFAVVRDTNTVGSNTTVRSSFGYTRTGGGWAASIGDGTFLDQDGGSVPATRACIDFPDDFDVDALTANMAFVGLVAGTAGAADEEGDVYKVIFQPTLSSTVDLNVRGIVSALSPTETNVTSIDVTGDSAGATIVIGTDLWSTGITNYYWLSYYSMDSGATWSTAREKSPTGGSRGIATPVAGADTRVVMSPADSSIVFAATKGDETSAISRSIDGAKSFNQISCIDYSSVADNYTIKSSTGVTPYSRTNSLYIVTSATTALSPAPQPNAGALDTRGSLWRTTNGGGNWERLWSYANPTVTDTISGVSRTRDGAMFARDNGNGRWWRSTDDGVSFPRVVVMPQGGGVVSYLIEDANTMWVAYNGGALWMTTNMGRPWTQMDDDRVISLNPIGTIMKSGDNMMVWNTAGDVYFSSDVGVTFERLGVTRAAAGCGAGFDPDFATNNLVYGSATAPGAASGGVWRIEVNKDDPGSTEWDRIDDQSDGYLTVNPYRGMAMALPGVMYVFDYASVNTTTTDSGGGVWRSVNPSADYDGVYPPEFYKWNRGLTNGDMYVYSGISFAPYTVLLKNASFAQTGNDFYYNQLVGMYDTLADAVALVQPANNAKGQGVRLSTTALTMTVGLTWKAVSGATRYEYQVADDAVFESLRANDTTTAQSLDVAGLSPNKTYYWRVRVSSPLISAWSESRQFTTSTTELLEAVVSVKSPALGATNVQLKPVFAWSPVIGALGYEWEVAKDPAFAVPVERSARAYAKVNSVVLAHDLEYSTTYYWRVNAVLSMKPPAATSWATGVFTTMAAPVEAQPPVVVGGTPPPPQVIQVPTPAAIPSYLLWAIVVIGAVLIIAVVVLIVRTRRVP
ncbi:hypothetical protein ACFLT8_03880 [Chloroflexota bacterium]